MTARGGSLVVNFGGAGGDLLFFDTFAKTGATSTSATVTLTDATNIVAGMSVTGSGVPVDTLVNTVVGTTVTLNKATTTTVASNALTFYAAQNNARINSSVFVLNGANADSPISLANPLDLNGFARTIQVSANTATLAGYLKNSSTTAASVRKTGAGALIQDPGAAYALTLAGLNTSAGTLELKSGTYTITGSAGTSAPASTTGFVVATGGTFRLSGATVNATGGSFVFPAGNTGGGSSNFILDSGTFDGGTKEALNAYGAAGTTTINGGLFICGTFRVSQNTGFLNLNGGTLRTTNLSTGGGTATVNLNGGTLQAKAANATFIATGITVAQVQAGGAVIDSNGFAITIPKSLTEDPGSIGGGLIKKGAGTLTLTAANSYTGPTSVTVGTLALVGGSQTSPITVDSGAALGFTLGSPTTSTSTVTFSGATAKVTVTGTPVAATLMTASNIIGTPVLDPAIPGYVLAIEGGGTLLNLKSTSPSANYGTWATTNGVTGQAANLDHDNDGVSNGVEYFIGGPTGNTTGFTPVPGVTTTAGVSSITWIKASTYTGVYNTDYFVETSATLAAGSWVTEASPGTVAISGNNVTYTFPAGPVKNFARLKVTGP